MSNIINNVTDSVSKISINAFGPLETFLKEMDVTITGPRHYRDNKTGRMVSPTTIMELFANWGRTRNIKENDDMTNIDQNTETEMDDQKNEVESFSNSFTETDEPRPLPDWSTMTLGEILPKVAYVKKVTKNGVTNRVPLLDDNGNFIPTRNAGDGGEYTKWSETERGEDPSTVALNKAAKAEAMLLSWGYELGSYSLDKEIGTGIRRDIEILKSGISASNVHPFMDAEDVVEVIQIRIEEKEEKARVALRRWVIEALKGRPEQQKKLLKLVRNEFNKAMQDGAECEYEERARIVTHLSWGAYPPAEGSNNGKWISNPRMASAVRVIESFLTEADPLGFPVTLTSQVKRIIGNYATKFLWNGWRKPMNDAIKGTLLRWVSAELQIETLAVMAEDRHIDRQVGTFRTDRTEIFRKETVDYMWDNRESGAESVRRNGKWIPTDVLAYALMNGQQHPFLK